MVKNIRWVILVVGIAALVVVGVANASSSNAPLNYSGKARSGYYCSGTNTTNHPVGDKLAADYNVTYQEIMDRFCLEGYGFGEINLAYNIAQQAGVGVTEVFDMRATGVGWGNIMKNYGLHGKSGKTVVTTTVTTTTTTTLSTTPTPPQMNGNGNSQGNSHGKGKAKGKSK